MDTTTNSPRCIGGLLRLGLLMGSFLIALPQTATAQNNCLQDEYGGNTQCTSKDVKIAFATNPRDLTGNPQLTCIAGTHFSFIADFHITTTATARENIGMYFATNGQGSALKGLCADNIIAPSHASPNPLTTVSLGEPAYPGSNPGYESLDPAPDNCGDISTNDNNQVVTVEVDNVLCQADPTTGQLSLPNCTSWQQPGGTIQCVSAPPTYPWVPAAIPGSPSKCNCNAGFTVPIAVQMPGISITKSCNTAMTTGSGNTTCDAGQEGGSVTYNLAISNTSNFGTVIVDQICDSAYGTVYHATGYSPTCAAGTVGTVTGTNGCASGLSIMQNTSNSCSFAVTQGESTTVKNVISVYAHGDSGKPITPNPSASNQVTVTSEDAPSTATITKSLVSTQNACATIRYGVDVKNTSGADEALTLSALTDSAFGDVTTVHGSVVATTCNVSSTSTQTLAVGGPDYTCTFDAQFCAAPSTIVTTPGTCTAGTCTAGMTGNSCSANSDCNVTCTGIQHSNQVSATLVGDEGETVTQTPGALTVSQCITSSAR